MQKGNVKTEQININGEVIIDYDQKLSPKEQLNILKKTLGAGAKEITVDGRNCIKYKHNEKIELILTLTMTYLGNPHPHFKKRAQLKEWYLDFYEKYNKDDTTVKVIGLYYYETNIIFADFILDTYIKRQLNNSSAHVYTNDLYQATTYGGFKRIDKNKNVINFINQVNFEEYLCSGKMPNTTLFNIFEQFNSDFLDGNWILAKNAILEMKQHNFYQWKGTEWAGWFLEYKMDNFIKENNYSSRVAFVANIKDKLTKPLDFDLYFFEDDYYGDLKSSDKQEKETPGNDQINLMKAVLFHSKFWYIIYEHDTKKDKDYGNEMALARMDLIGETIESKGHISYAERMKHSVRYTDMKILEVNSANFKVFMDDFTQGKQANGQTRAPKFKIDKKNIENFIIYSHSI